MNCPNLKLTALALSRRLIIFLPTRATLISKGAPAQGRSDTINGVKRFKFVGKGAFLHDACLRKGTAFLKAQLE